MGLLFRASTAPSEDSCTKGRIHWTSSRGALRLSPSPASVIMLPRQAGLDVLNGTLEPNLSVEARSHVIQPPYNRWPVLDRTCDLVVGHGGGRHLGYVRNKHGRPREVTCRVYCGESQARDGECATGEDKRPQTKPCPPLFGRVVELRRLIPPPKLCVWGKKGT